jgi:hypothetical protein
MVFLKLTAWYGRSLIKFTADKNFIDTDHYWEWRQNFVSEKQVPPPPESTVVTTLSQSRDGLARWSRHVTLWLL